MLINREKIHGGGGVSSSKSASFIGAKNGASSQAKPRDQNGQLKMTRGDTRQAENWIE